MQNVKRRRPLRKIMLGLLLAGSVTVPASAKDLAFMHFWSSPGEMRALNEIRKSAARVGLTLKEEPVPGDFNEMRSALLASLLTESPPDATQWMVGDELGDLIDTGVLNPVRSDGVDFKQVLVPEIYDAVHRSGSITNMPLGIHIENFVVFNTEAFERIGRPLPQSWAELLDAAPALHEAGIAPLVLSSQAWQMQNLFPNILSSLLTAEEFSSYLNSTRPPVHLRAQIKETFRILGGLRQFAPEQLPDINHFVGAQMVSRGEAAAYGLGDYLVAELIPGAPLFCTLSPGATTVLMGVDGMAFVNRNDKTLENDIAAFVEDFYTNSGATDYVREKGGVSVLAKDHLEPPGDSCGDQSLRGWNTASSHLLLSSASWQNHLRIVGIFVAEFTADGTMSPDEAADELLRLMRQL